MRLQNQTGVGNIYNQNIAWLCLIFVTALSVVLHGVGQDTEPFDVHFEDIAGLHENGWLARRSDATGRAGDDHITALQTHRDTACFYQRCATDDEEVCARIL